MNMAFIRERLRPYLPQLALICLITLFGSAVTLALPLLAGRLLGGLIGEVSIDLNATLLLLVVALLAMTALNIIAAILSELASGRILAGLRRDAYTHVQSLPVQFYDQSRIGDILALVTYEVNVLSGFLANTLAMVPSNLITAFGAIVLLFLIDPVMTLIIPVLIPVFFVMMKLVGRRIRTLSKKNRDAEVGVFSAADRDLSIVPAIKSFGQEAAFRENYVQLVEAARATSFEQKRVSAFVQPVTAMIAALGAIGILVVGSVELTGEQRSAEELFAFLLYAALLTRPAGKLASLYGEWQWANGTLARLTQVLSIPAEPGYQATRKPENVRGALSFEKITFAYPGRETVLNKVNLEIAAGEIVALTGPNGVGKSTLVNLLLRFYEPQTGRIMLDGIDIREIDVRHLRRQIGYVPQRALLFDGNIRDNITFGETGTDPQMLEKAVQLSGASDFISTLPDGVETVIGDNGIRLSGGQRQRIALARALYTDPPILAFDEATSMYDMASEAAFVDNCIRSLTGRTIIIITHRTASLALADRVLEAMPTGYRQVAAKEHVAQ